MEVEDNRLGNCCDAGVAQQIREEEKQAEEEVLLYLPTVKETSD
jgi:hypothetical protein